MPQPEKPSHGSQYEPEALEQVKCVCLTLAVTLGAYLDDLCIVGGVVPVLLVDTRRDGGGERHPGTNDLDVALAVALLDDDRYTEIAARLRAENFAPDVNDAGNPTVQRWRPAGLKVTVDFLMPPSERHDPALRVQPLRPDFGALVTPGLELAFDERAMVSLDGHTLNGERVRRDIPVCGPAAFTVLKALAFGDRGVRKDAFDLIYVLRHTPGRGTAIAERLAAHDPRHRPIIARALEILQRDFADSDHLGPIRAAEFSGSKPPTAAELIQVAADLHGHVDDLLKACADLGLLPSPHR